jgi:hypothetical protein
MAGMKVVPVKVHSTGFLDLKAEQHKDNLAAFMVTYPSTYGVFEGGVENACDIIHENGGQVVRSSASLVPCYCLSDALPIDVLTPTLANVNSTSMASFFSFPLPFLPPFPLHFLLLRFFPSSCASIPPCTDAASS